MDTKVSPNSLGVYLEGVLGTGARRLRIALRGRVQRVIRQVSTLVDRRLSSILLLLLLASWFTCLSEAMWKLLPLGCVYYIGILVLWFEDEAALQLVQVRQVTRCIGLRLGLRFAPWIIMGRVCLVVFLFYLVNLQFVFVNVTKVVLLVWYRHAHRQAARWWATADVALLVQEAFLG